MKKILVALLLSTSFAVAGIQDGPDTVDPTGPSGPGVLQADSPRFTATDGVFIIVADPMLRGADVNECPTPISNPGDFNRCLPGCYARNSKGCRLTQVSHWRDLDGTLNCHCQFDCGKEPMSW